MGCDEGYHLLIPLYLGPILKVRSQLPGAEPGVRVQAASINYFSPAAPMLLEIVLLLSKYEIELSSVEPKRPRTGDMGKGVEVL